MCESCADEYASSGVLRDDHTVMYDGLQLGYTEKLAKDLTPFKAIRAKCLDCMSWQEAEVRRCEVAKCPLWPYRMGRMAPMTASGVNSSLNGSGKNRGTEAA